MHSRAVWIIPFYITPWYSYINEGQTSKVFNFIDVGDGYWRRNVLVTTIRCCWQFSPFWSPTSTNRHQLLVTNISYHSHQNLYADKFETFGLNLKVDRIWKKQFELSIEAIVKVQLELTDFIQSLSTLNFATSPSYSIQILIWFVSIGYRP